MKFDFVPEIVDFKARPEVALSEDPGSCDKRNERDKNKNVLDQFLVNSAIANCVGYDCYGLNYYNLIRTTDQKTLDKYQHSVFGINEEKINFE